LWRNASEWMMAWMGRGMFGSSVGVKGDFVITHRDITLCHLETAQKTSANQPG
jgi:hypothetical protein